MAAEISRSFFLFSDSQSYSGPMLRPSLLTGIAALVAYALYLNFSRTRLPLPPGPKGTLFSLPSVSSPYQWLGYAKWAETYGDLIYFSAFGNSIMVVNSYDAMIDLFERRGDIYSSRPIRTMVRELIGFDYLFASMPYGDPWRQCRTLFLKHFNTKDRSRYRALQTTYTHSFLRALLRDPENFKWQLRRSSAAIVLSLAYGYDVAGDNDEYVRLADLATKSLGRAGLFGTYLVDYVTWLKYLPTWFPFSGFQREAKEWRVPVRELLNRPFDAVKDRLREGKASPCLVADELERMYAGSSATSEDTIKKTAATTYAAGSDTVVSTLLSFFLAMTNFPEAQKSAQEEIDRVLQGRLPTHADRADLPLVESLCRELLRWNPVTPLVIPRTVSEDNEYRGYLIPKGTTIVANVWAALHDKRYPDPLEFKVDRFLDQAKNVREGINPNPDIAFGFGRRVCAGKELATEFIWLMVASLLASYNILKAVDKAGNVIEAPIEYTPYMISHPKDFKCAIRPRSAAVVSTIEQTIDI